MKKIINNKVYDTETAKLLGRADNGCGYNDFNWVRESLFRKKTGEYFLFGEGGANTRYAESVGSNSWSGGWAIFPFTVERAREWAENNLSADDYENIFGIIPEGEERQSINICLPNEAVEAMNLEAERLKMSVSEYIEFLIRGSK